MSMCEITSYELCQVNFLLEKSYYDSKLIKTHLQIKFQIRANKQLKQ